MSTRWEEKFSKVNAHIWAHKGEYPRWGSEKEEKCLRRWLFKQVKSLKEGNLEGKKRILLESLPNWGDGMIAVLEKRGRKKKPLPLLDENYSVYGLTPEELPPDPELAELLAQLELHPEILDLEIPDGI